MKRYSFLVLALVLALAVVVPTIAPASPAYACEQGLTPGWWKNHLDAWVGFSPTQSLDSAFGITATPDIDLLTALRQGGGEEEAFLRQAVAALLNSTFFTGGLFWSTDTVRMYVERAYSGVESFEWWKDYFERSNSLGVPWD